MVDAVFYYRIKKFNFGGLVMGTKNIVRGIVEFVGGFAIGCASVLALRGFQTLVNKAFEDKKGGER
jgi:hypothetical protein